MYSTLSKRRNNNNLFSLEDNADLIEEAEESRFLGSPVHRHAEQGIKIVSDIFSGAPSRGGRSSRSASKTSKAAAASSTSAAAGSYESIVLAGRKAPRRRRGKPRKAKKKSKPKRKGGSKKRKGKKKKGSKRRRKSISKVSFASGKVSFYIKDKRVSLSTVSVLKKLSKAALYKLLRRFKN
jgi:hypothetical protein